MHICIADASVLTWKERKTYKYTSPDMQNEILQVMSHTILRNVADNLRHGRFYTFYTIMADETTEQSNREQVILVLRHVDSELNVHEEFVGLYIVPVINAHTLTNTIEETLLRLNLSINNCRGQCYDGASNISGAKKGVATNIRAREHLVIL